MQHQKVWLTYLFVVIKDAVTDERACADNMLVTC